MEEILSIVMKLIRVEALVAWLSRKLSEEYGVKSLEVKRLKDAVVLVIKGDNLDKVENELREAISKLGIGESVKIEVGDGSGLRR